MELSEIKTKLKDAGVAGAGGAGFPSYAKLAEGADTLILNCAECEPLLTLHRQLLAQKADEILSAFSAVGKALGVKNCIVGVKSSYKQTLAALNAKCGAYGVGIKTLKEMYPAGDEVVLIYQVTGRVVDPGKLPISQKVIVYNVETVFNAYNALKGIPVTHKYVTVAAAVARPITVRVPIGTEFRQLIELAGGATVEDYTVISGGAMMGKIASPYDTVTKTTNAVLCLPSDHPVVTGKQRKPSIDAKRAASACCQCRMCTELCPRYLLGHPIDPSKFMRAVANRDVRDTQAYLNALYCSSCGLCESFSCMQGLSPRRLLAVAKDRLRAEGIKPEPKDAAPVHPLRSARRVPVDRLAARLKLGEYSSDAPITDVSFTPDSLRISLRQNIGAPSVAVVKDGDKVRAGQLIAAAADGLSLPLHAPLGGTVQLAGGDIIIKGIEK